MVDGQWVPFETIYKREKGDRRGEREREREREGETDTDREKGGHPGLCSSASILSITLNITYIVIIIIVVTALRVATGSSEEGPPASLAGFVSREMGRTEALLKVVGSRPENLIDNFFTLMPSGTPADFNRIQDLKVCPLNLCRFPLPHSPCLHA